MRTNRESERRHEARGIGDVRDPYAELYHEDEQPLLLRVVRAVVPWIALIAVVTVALTLWSEFRFEAGRSNPPGETTGTVSPESDPGTASADATGAVPTDAPYVRVKADGLNLRAEASTGSAVIKKLPTGTILVYVEAANGWYHVRDDTGTEGWVAAGGSFTELVQP